MEAVSSSVPAGSFQGGVELAELELHFPLSYNARSVLRSGVSIHAF